MNHRIKNVRTGEVFDFSDVEFRDFILKETKCSYNPSSVAPERTGRRFHKLKPLILRVQDSVNIDMNIYIITAVSRINNDPNSRYMIIIDGEVSNGVLKLFKDNVPVIQYIRDIESEEFASTISKWFRSYMGRNFSFIDADYILSNTARDKALIIEEKNYSSAGLGYGQQISYCELLTDIINVDAELWMLRTENDKVAKYCYRAETNQKKSLILDRSKTGYICADNFVIIIKNYFNEDGENNG